MAAKPKYSFDNKLYVLIHPVALALHVFTILLFSLPNYFQKYVGEVISSKVS